MCRLRYSSSYNVGLCKPFGTWRDRPSVFRRRLSRGLSLHKDVRLSFPQPGNRSFCLCGCLSSVYCPNSILVALMANLLPAFSIISDVILAAFPILLLRNTRLKFKTKVALNALMGLGIVTAIVCIIRTAFSYEVKNTEDPTWDGIPNALCRMLEVNFGIIASCMPMIRTFYIWAKRRLRQARNSESIPSTRTPLSQLEWYHPPTDKPWYHRLRHTLFRRPDPPFELSPSSSQQSVPKVPSKSRDHDEEKDTQHGQQQQRQRIQLKHQPRSIPPPPKAKHKQAGKYTSRAQRARHYDRPANATWAKEDSQPRSYSQPRESLQPKKSESLDLPLQGPRKSEYGNEYGGGSGDFGGFEYHRGKSLK